MSQLTIGLVIPIRLGEFLRPLTTDLLGDKKIVEEPLSFVNTPGKIVSKNILTLGEYKAILKNYPDYNGFYIPNNTTIFDNVTHLSQISYPIPKIEHTLEEVKSILDLEYDIMHNNLDRYDILDHHDLKKQNEQDLNDLYHDFGAIEYRLHCNKEECESTCMCYICDTCCGCRECWYDNREYEYNIDKYDKYDEYDIHIPNKAKTIKPFRLQHRLLHSLPSDVFNKDGMLMITRPNKGPFVKLKRGVIVEYNSKEYCVVDNHIDSDRNAHITLLRNAKTPFKRKTFKRNVFAGRKVFY